MREGWDRLQFGDVAKLDVRKAQVVEGKLYPIVGVLAYGRGLLYRDPVSLGSTSYREMNLIRPEQMVYSKLKAFEGAITVAPEGLTESYASGEFPTFTATDRVQPAFLRLMTQRPGLWKAMAANSKGLGGRRERLNPVDFLALPALFPPVPEQRRIVDLIGALDDVAGALADAINAAQETRGFLLEALLARLPEATALKPMGSVGVFLRGRRFTKSDYVDEGLGCIHYGQIHTHLGSVTTHPLTFVPEEMRGRLRLASPGDVVVAATSEDVEGLGKATAWLGKDDVAVHDDCYIFRHSLDPRFATHLFASKGFQRQKVQFAAGTKVTRISGANLGRIEVPVPDLADQTVIGQTMSDLDATLDSLTLERSRVRSLRSHALAVLLSGEHEIPKSYDGLMEVPS